MKFKSATMTSASGSLGGITASRNKGGMYFRGRGIPTQPNTARQTLVRTILGSLVQAYNSSLAATQRTLWGDYGTAVPNTGPLGDPVPLSGQQAYVRANTARLQANLGPLAIPTTRVDDPPSVANSGEPPTKFNPATLTAGVLTMDVDLATNASANGHALLYVGPPQNESVSFFKGPYQLAATAPVTAATTAFTFDPDTAVPAEWAAGYTPAIDQRIPMRVVIAYDDGRVSQALQQIVTITTP